MYLEQFTVGDEPVVVHVIDAESETQFGQLVALHAELRHALDELLEVHLERTNTFLPSADIQEDNVMFLH